MYLLYLKDKQLLSLSLNEKYFRKYILLYNNFIIINEVIINKYYNNKIT